MGTVIPFRLRDRSGAIPKAARPARTGPCDHMTDLELMVAYRELRGSESDFETPGEARVRANIEIEMRRRDIDTSAVP